jgi:hypothetical protein
MAGGRGVFPERQHEADLCVVGGGMAGLSAALSAARHGARVVLMHDRPVLGGNASSEIRVHVCGADRQGGIDHVRETGIVEEIRLDNLCRNPTKSFAVWDAVLYEKALAEENLTLLLNCTCQDAEMASAGGSGGAGRIASVTGWQLTTQTYHTVRAALFADCSGDAILAPLTGAEFRVGREGQGEFGESFAPERADRRTMGMTCWFMAREHDAPQPFDPPAWARRFQRCDELPYGEGCCKAHALRMGYWWIELGGEADSIHDTERLRDELLPIAYGVWDHLKNHCPHNRDLAANWAIEWVNFLPGKRESRRYVGDYLLTQNDLAAGGQFDDVVAYGGWTMDDHHPAGFRAVELGEKATIFHGCPSPYGIPYRCLYSRNVENLFVGGRCISATHMALSSTRVMATCSVMAQAMGTAAAMAVRLGTGPRGVGEHVKALQQALLRDDCYLPGVARELSELNASADLTASRGDGRSVRDGIARQVGDEPHCWVHSPGDWIAYGFGRPRPVAEVSLALDSDMTSDPQMHFTGGGKHPPFVPPPVLPKAFRVEGLAGGEWAPLVEAGDNRQRFVRVPVGREMEGVRYTLTATRGADQTRLYAFYVD